MVLQWMYTLPINVMKCNGTRFRRNSVHNFGHASFPENYAKALH